MTDLGSCLNQFCLMCSTSSFLVKHDIAQWLPTAVGSCPNQFCLSFSTRLCLFRHDIAQLLLTAMTDVGSCPN